MEVDLDAVLDDGSPEFLLDGMPSDRLGPEVVAEQLGLDISDKELDTMLKQMDENDDGREKNDNVDRGTEMHN